MNLQLHHQFVIQGHVPRCKVVSMSYRFEISAYQLR